MSPEAILLVWFGYIAHLSMPFIVTPLGKGDGGNRQMSLILVYRTFSYFLERK